MLKLKNFETKAVLVDRLARNNDTLAVQENRCSNKVCLGSVVNPNPPVQLGHSGDQLQSETLSKPPRTPEQVKTQALDFFNQYFSASKSLNSECHKERLATVLSEIQLTGTYTHTVEELEFGARTAWRNAPRCIAKYYWNKLNVFDAREIKTAQGMFEACCRHLEWGTNGGNVMPAITIFPQRKPGDRGVRIWNYTLVGFAGYKNADGSITGDPINTEFTEICQNLGWKGKGGRFDVLPIVISTDDEDPQIFEIPDNFVLLVSITHPKFDWFGEMGLKWYAMPSIANLLLEVGGVEFPSVPINGWILNTEVGCRNLGDTWRYNVYPEIGKRMGLDVTNTLSLWIDRAMLELNVAVIHSYQKAGVSIVDHHAASNAFMKFFESETRTRGGCPADWVWLNSPMSPSATGLFHQEMLNYYLKPSFEYQDRAWVNFRWKRPPASISRALDLANKRRSGRMALALFKKIATSVRILMTLCRDALSKRPSVTILFGSETGKSENYARQLNTLFSHAFNSKVMPMAEYDLSNLSSETLVLIVTSTFGNGDGPENAEEFGRNLQKMKDKCSDSEQSIQTKFAVFALGSSAYEKFCQFGLLVDELLAKVGAERLLPVQKGDELAGQVASFEKWSRDILKTACESFQIKNVLANEQISGNTNRLARLRPVETPDDDAQALSRLHSRKMGKCRFRSMVSHSGPLEIVLQKAEKTPGQDFSFTPGDHLCVQPQNPKEMVAAISKRLINKPKCDRQPIQLEYQYQNQSSNTNWTCHDRLPRASLFKLLTLYCDITTPPTPEFLSFLATSATSIEEIERLNQLAQDENKYTTWRDLHWPNLVRVLEEFPSVQPDAAMFCLLLPPLRLRYYSIASSPRKFPNEIHLTVTLLTFDTPAAKPIQGLCSHYLSTLKENETVFCAVRRAPSFHMPQDSSCPLILIGPGSGLAPFRGFWQDRHFEMLQNQKNSSFSQFGKVTIFFGCRTRDRILYGREMKELENLELENDENGNEVKLASSPFKFHIAFSREAGIKKTYVQDLLKTEAPDIARQILDEGAHIYVCGDRTMGKQVRATILSIIQTQGQLSVLQAETFLANLKERNGYHEDVYGFDAGLQIKNSAAIPQPA